MMTNANRSFVDRLHIRVVGGFRITFYDRNPYYGRLRIIIPRTGDVFSVRLSVCPSVRPRRFVWNSVRLTPSRVFNAQERSLYHMKTLDE